MNVAILGFGTVGYGVYELTEKLDNVNVKYVLDLVKHDDISAKSVTDIKEILEDTSVDTVVELIGGKHPAYDFIKASLEAGKNVITANKLVICEFYEELTKLAVSKGVALRYTAAVGGGIPWLTNLERTARISKVHKISGIFNGTPNYILDAMHTAGTAFADALKTAQKLGFAEANPSSDIDGLDTQRKIAISANIAFGVAINPEDVDVIGISKVSAKAISDFEAHGYIAKLIATTVNKDGKISAFVEPTLVAKSSDFANVPQNYNLIAYDADNVGHGSYMGFGAGRYPTAYTVTNDCIDVANGVKKTYNDTMDSVKPDNNAISHSYYISAAVLPDVKIKEKWNSGVVTEEMSVKEMHTLYKKMLESDPEAFIAGIY